jgi:hypothetical protein
VTLALGVLGANRSEHAIRAATTKATVVKKVNTFWARLMVEFIVARGWGVRYLSWSRILCYCSMRCRIGGRGGRGE